MTVSFLLLDPSKIAEIRTQYLLWARAAVDTAWGAELPADRAVTVEKEVRKAKTAVEKDSKFLLRKVLGARMPTPTPHTQSFWISGAEAASHGSICAKCSHKSEGSWVFQPWKPQNVSPDLVESASTVARFVKACAILTTAPMPTTRVRQPSMIS